jgi:hypothetical protein
LSVLDSGTTLLEQADERRVVVCELDHSDVHLVARNVASLFTDRLLASPVLKQDVWQCFQQISLQGVTSTLARLYVVRVLQEVLVHLLRNLHFTSVVARRHRLLIKLITR